MKVLIFPLGSRGDVHPFVGMGTALAARGHDVTVGANAAFSDLVSRAGLQFVEVGTREELEEAFAEEVFWHPYLGYARVVEKIIMPAMQRQYDVVVDRCRNDRDTVIVGSTVAIGARIAHEKLGIPLIGAHVQPMVIWSERQSPVVGPLLLGNWVPRLLKRMQFRSAESLTVQRWMLEPANAFRAELDLAPFADVDDLLHAPERVLGLFPEWFAPTQPDWPQQFEHVDFPLWDDMETAHPDTRLERFCDRGDPPLAFTLSSTDWHAKEFYATAVEACRMLGRRGILLCSDPSNLPPALPQGVIHADYVPFRWLLSRVAGLVHHGGMGTCAQAMAAGLPQVIRPVCFDQPDNAERLRRLGVSVTLRYQDFTPRRLTRALRQMLDSPDVARRCSDVASRFDHTQGMERAAEIIEYHANRPRSSSRPPYWSATVSAEQEPEELADPNVAS